MCVTVLQGALLRFITLPALVTKFKGFSYRDYLKDRFFIKSELIFKITCNRLL
jgi:hypothetical protein